MVAVTGLLARLAAILAEHKIPMFAMSTFDTDYILIRGENTVKAEEGFRDRGMDVDVIRN